MNSVDSDAATPDDASTDPDPDAFPKREKIERNFTPVQRKARQVFTYLKELDEVRNPVQRDIADAAWSLHLMDLPTHECCAVRSDLAALLLHEARLDDSAEPILTVRRPEFTPPPEPPAHLMDWIEGRWREPSAEISTRPWILVEPERQGEPPKRVSFDDDPGRIAAWRAYIATRNAWRDREIPARKVAALLDRLFDLHARLDREGERFDLVLADGLLTWRVASGALHYPVLHQPLDLHFDPEIPEFSLLVSERPAVFHSTLFRGVTEAPPKVTAEMRQRVEEEGITPLQQGEAEALFRALVGKLHPHGWFGEDSGAGLDPTAPRIQRRPLLFLRDRAQGFGAFIERLIEATDDEAFQPAKPLLPVIGYHPIPSDETGPASSPDDVLLSKPANREQIQVAMDLARSDGVIVQGPPGTGKSHTIANLIGDLLAKKCRVLVTSHTSKALRVLQDKIVEPLQPLSVSVITDDVASQAELEKSIRRIAERLGSDSADDLERRAEELRQERAALLREVESIQAELLAARECEYRPIVVGGRSYSPSDAARLVHAGRQKDDWIPAGVERGAPLSLSASEVRDLYTTNGTLTAEDERELSMEPPAPEDVLAPEAFESLVGEAGRVLEARWLRYWKTPPTSAALTTISGLVDHLQDLVSTLEGLTDWERRALTAAIRGGEESSLWEEFADDAEQLIGDIRKASVAVRRYGPQVPERVDQDEIRETARALTLHVRGGGSLGRLSLMMRPSWRRFLETVRVDDRTPATPDEFEAVAHAVDLHRLRNEIRRRWERLVDELAPEPVDKAQPEILIEQRVARIRELIAWPDSRIAEALAAVEAVGFTYNEPTSKVFTAETAELDRVIHDLREVGLPAVVEYRSHCLRLKHQEKLDALRLRLADHPEASVGGQMRAAIRNHDTQGYSAAYGEVLRLAGLKATLVRRQDLLGRLRPVAEAWADAIARRSGEHGESEPPGDPEAAWLWRQLEDEIVARSQADIQALQDKLSRTQENIHRATALLVENLAWAAQIRRTSGQARQDLLGYLKLLKRIGKGTGKRAPRLRVEAQKKLKSCRAAVPVWIMPLARVVESFDPADTRFNVVIIDEASQMDVMGLLAFQLADKVLVVGDDEQVSPAAVGQKLDIVDQLIGEHLTGIPNAELYDGQTSIYDLAGMSFSASRMLKEHFRCVPEIIAYSNELAYHGRIQPLRDGSRSRLKPPTIAHRVRGGQADASNVNLREAEETVALIAAAIEQPEYRDATFGVIALLGNAHATKVDELLRRWLRTDEYARHRLLCGNPAQFQGDERDVIFLNMVKGPTGAGPLSLMSPDHKVWKQRYNVAASRAKDQLWVVHSIDPAVDLQAADIRAGLLRHVVDPASTERKIAQVEQRADSTFEVEVAADLIRAGYRVQSQFPVGRYRIDLVVECGDQRVAVECDGDRFHTIENLQADLERQAILERLGWRFVRIRGTQFFRNRTETMAQVMEKLERLGIRPEGSGDEPHASKAARSDLHGRVVRRAAELLREWRNSDTREELGRS